MNTKGARADLWLGLAIVISIGIVLGFAGGFPAYLRNACEGTFSPVKPPSYTFSIQSNAHIDYRPTPKDAPRGALPIAEGSQQKAEGRAEPAEDAGSKPESWWNNFRCDVNASDYFIALFTLILAVVTGFLWWTTHRLWKSGEGQIAATKMAAEAADLSAKAAVGVEIARLVMRKVELPNLNPTSWNLPGTKISVKWVNLGRTEGLIVFDCLVWEVCLDLAPSPRYPLHTQHAVPSTMVVKPDEHFQFQRDFRLTEEQIAQLTSGNARLWVYGYVDFLDFLNRTNRVGFCRVAKLGPHPLYGASGMLVASFTYGGPKSYVYTKQVD